MKAISAAGRLAPPASAKHAALSRRQKAAIIVRFLLNEGADVTLSDLPENLQADLTQLIGDMRYVDRETLAAVVMEFAAELESIGLFFPRGLGGALSALEGRISPFTAERLRKEAGAWLAGDPWGQIRSLDTDKLKTIVERESIEVAAVVLSKLDVAKAAELLGMLPGETARRITYAVSLTGGITPDAVERIGITLATELEDAPPRAFAQEPVARIGEILNFSGAATRDSVLSGLDETDAGFASEVRKAIFTFADIPKRLVPKDVPRAVREMDQADMVQAIAGAQTDETAAAAQYLLENISGRLADQLREEVDERGQVSARDAETAQTRAVAAIRALADADEIRLLEPDETD